MNLWLWLEGTLKVTKLQHHPKGRAATPQLRLPKAPPFWP